MDNKDHNSIFFDIFFGIRKKIFLFFYIFSIVNIGLVAIFALGELFPASPRLQIAFGIFFTIASTVGGAFLSVILELPKIGAKFDTIKNDIAQKKIKGAEEFSERIVSFLRKNFTFFFLTINYAFVKILNSDRIYSDDAVLSSISDSDFDTILKKSRESEAFFYFGPCVIKAKRRHLYIFPIWFGQEWLGYIGILTESRLSKLFCAFFTDFENHYVDDQLVHVLDIQKQSIQKQFYRELDLISNKISLQEYKNLQRYQKEILLFLVDQIHCAGGLFATVYDEDCVTHFRDGAFDDGQIKTYYRNCYQKHIGSLQPRLRMDPQIPFKYAFEIPIAIKTLQGVILLFDHQDENFHYFHNTIAEIENIKLDNDLQNLTRILGLSPSPKGFVKAF